MAHSFDKACQSRLTPPATRKFSRSRQVAVGLQGDAAHPFPLGRHAPGTRCLQRDKFKDNAYFDDCSEFCEKWNQSTFGYRAIRHDLKRGLPRHRQERSRHYLPCFPCRAVESPATLNSVAGNSNLCRSRLGGSWFCHSFGGDFEASPASLALVRSEDAASASSTAKWSAAADSSTIAPPGFDREQVASRRRPQVLRSAGNQTVPVCRPELSVAVRN